MVLVNMHNVYIINPNPQSFYFCILIKQPVNLSKAVRIFCVVLNQYFLESLWVIPVEACYVILLQLLIELYFPW